MHTSKSPRRELLEIWTQRDKGKGPVLFPPDLSHEGGPPPHLSKAYKRLWLDHLGNSLYLDSILKKGWEHTPRPWRRLLCLAFSELQWSPNKDLHGVVHDWVEQGRRNLGEKSVKVLNGTLRTACRDLEKEKAPRSGLPEHLRNLLSNEQPRELLDKPQQLYGFLPKADIKTECELETEIIKHSGLGELHRLIPGTPPHQWAKKTGAFIQNLSAAEVSLEIMTRFNGKNLLDFCAAPGGKTWQLLRLGLPRITFHDHSESRLASMTNSDLARFYGPKMSPLGSSEEEFDGVIIDLPCSNSGVLGKCPEAVRHYWTPATCFAELQEEVFVASLNLLRPKGQLFYSTCSIDPVENELRVSSLASRYGLRLVYDRKWAPDENGRHGAYFAELQNCE